MKKWIMQSLLVSLLFFGFTSASSQSKKTVVTDIFTVVYSEDYQQPIKLKYTVQCPLGDVKRGGIGWREELNIVTSNNKDYENNVWDRGHLAPAAAFNCDRETLKETFTYLNCALQHEGLNRGPWKELERFERNLAKFSEVVIIVEVDFDEQPLRVPAGAAIPRGFFKTIHFKDNTWKFYFPNVDVAGEDWYNFIIAE